MRSLCLPVLLTGLLLASPTQTVCQERADLTDEQLLDMVQKHTFRYFWDYGYPGSGLARERTGGRTFLDPFGPEQLIPEDGPQSAQGLNAAYFANMTFSGEPVLQRIEPSIDADWQSGSPDPLLPADKFSAIWKGSVVFPETGEYEIGLASDDGACLYFDDALLLDNWGNHAYQRTSQKVRVEADRPYRIRVDYYEDGGMAAIRLGLVKVKELSLFARIEEDTENDRCAVGGTGMGVMAIIVGTDRTWISREEAAQRILTIVTFLEQADRFHGAFPHWLNGRTGRTMPFSEKDDGADLVETSYLFMGLLTARAYFTHDTPTENLLREKITGLWNAVEWDWFTRGEDVLYWHWSPRYEWSQALQIRGWNECLITYVLAASSPTHPISATVYHRGFARNGDHQNGLTFFGIELPLGEDFGGPLFFAHYSFLGLDPRDLSDTYADYWEQNVNHTLINRAHCVENGRGYQGYGQDCWGLTASDNYQGYAGHSPVLDLGVISPTAALSSMPYTPEYSLDALRYFYFERGDTLWGRFGFYDAFSETRGWYADSYLAIDQGPIIIMIENYRTGLLWDLFMSVPEIRVGLEKLDFEGNF